MTGAVTIIIDGHPVAKGRPRMTRAGFAYTPAATRKWEAHGRLAAQVAMDGRPPFNVPCRAGLVVALPVPASWSRKRQAAAVSGDLRPTSRPDIDNYVKAALDAINEIAIRDDSLIVELSATKRYAAAGRLTITIEPVTAGGSA